MRTGTARAIAAEWVLKYASHEAWFRGAYFSGSTIELADHQELSEASDMDVMIVTSHADAPPKLGKFKYKDVQIEATYLTLQQLSNIEEVLISYHLANSFRVNTIIADPTGHLRNLQEHVSRLFFQREWVRRRCRNATQRIENGIRAIDNASPWHDQVTSWLFPTGVTTHVLLVAALKNPTVRLRYLAARHVLQSFGHEDIYKDLLKLLGCYDLTPQRVQEHLDELAHTFDAAAAIAKTPFFFRTDITASSRPIAIRGSQELIHSGNHREAVFWIAATFARCNKILAADAPELERKLARSFHALTTDLGIHSSADLIRRGEAVLQFLPKLWDTVEFILLNHPNIKGK